MQVISGKLKKAQKGVFYGPEGIGKSTLATQLPSPIFIDTEGSTSNLEVDRLPKPSSWTMLLEQVEWVRKSGKYKSLIIDTVDWAERLAIDFVTSRSNKQSITNFGYGEGFIQLEEEFGKFLNKLSDLVEIGINVVLTAHAKITKFEQPDEMGAYDRYELKLGNKTTAKTAALAKEWADMVLFINYKTFSVAADAKGTKHKGQGGVRTVYATHHPAWDAKNRHGLPDEFPLDYAQIAHIFNSSTPAVPVTTTTSATSITPPPVETSPQPQSQTEPTQQPVQQQLAAQTSQQLDPNIPASLRDLMMQHQVTEKDIQIVVSQKGYYPMDTPITNYDSGFINGVLVGAWTQVHKMIQDFKANLPF
ncbi:ATP-binding protein [Paenibacillus sp. FSL K6-2524]|uniref:ATP-binding protein n=1 Tax=Paenibacillus sp. FSL K6-2524 TaxID=2954516 RepID=UPI0030F64ED3